MAETKYFNHDLEAARAILDELIHSSYQKEYMDIRRASLICLIFILKIRGAEPNLKNLS